MTRTAPFTAACAAYAALALAASAPPPCAGDQAAAWTDLAARVAAEESPTPAAAVQAQSMVRAAVRTALDRSAAGRRGDAGLAAAVAAHDVLWRLYPRRREELDARMGGCAATPASPAAQAGAQAAAQVLRVQWPGELGPSRALPRALPAVALPPETSPARASPKALEKGPAGTQPWWRERQPVSL